MSKKKDKPARLRARLPKGLKDSGAGEIRRQQAMLDVIRRVYESYGFEPLETPAFEYTDALGKFLPDEDRPNEGVFSFQDDDEQWLSLRYDLTAPLARYVAENVNELPKPFRRYQCGPVWRNEKPGPGRFRQFLQFDADTVGAPTVAADAEMCMMAADTLEALGIERGDYVIKVNNRKVFDGLLEEIGLGGETNASKRLAVLRAIDKLDRLGSKGVKALLGDEGRWDGGEEGKGDFTKGAGLSPQQIEDIFFVAGGQYTSWVAFTEREEIPTQDEIVITQEQLHADFGMLVDSPSGEFYFSNDQIISGWQEGLANTEIGKEGLEELNNIISLARSAGYGSNRIRVASDVVRGLEYYTGPVFEAELTFEVTSEHGGRFGSVGGGGRYDDLVARFTGQKVPATGFSIGVSRLAAALEALGKLDEAAAPGPVVVTVFDRDSAADSQKLVARLRAAGIRAEMYLGNPKTMGAQFKYADRRGSPCVVIQGPDEKAKGEVQIKDLVEGARLSAEIEDNVQWREGRPAQFAAKEEDLVDEVRTLLARYPGASPDREE